MHIIGNNPILKFITIAPFDREKLSLFTIHKPSLPPPTPLCNEAESSKYTSTEHSKPPTK
jgi:hypothetical protein